MKMRVNGKDIIFARFACKPCGNQMMAQPLNEKQLGDRVAVDLIEIKHVHRNK